MYYRKHHHRHHRHHHHHSLRSRWSRKRLRKYSLILLICFTFAFTINLMTSKLRSDLTGIATHIERVNDSSANKLIVTDSDRIFFKRLMDKHVTGKHVMVR